MQATSPQGPSSNNKSVLVGIPKCACCIHNDARSACLAAIKGASSSKRNIEHHHDDEAEHEALRTDKRACFPEEWMQLDMMGGMGTGGARLHRERLVAVRLHLWHERVAHDVNHRPGSERHGEW